MKRNTFNCWRCGKAFRTKNGTICPSCAQELSRNFDEDEDLKLFDESDGSPMCVTCGQEYSTYLRSNGKYYCSMCWQTWNS